MKGRDDKPWTDQASLFGTDNTGWGSCFLIYGFSGVYQRVVLPVDTLSDVWFLISGLFTQIIP